MVLSSRFQRSKLGISNHGLEMTARGEEKN